MLAEVAQTHPHDIFHDVNAELVAHTAIHCTEVSTRSRVGLPFHVLHPATCLFQPRWRIHVNRIYQLPSATIEYKFKSATTD